MKLKKKIRKSDLESNQSKSFVIVMIQLTIVFHNRISCFSASITFLQQKKSLAPIVWWFIYFSIQHFLQCFSSQKPRGIARSDAEAKKFAEEDLIAAKAREARIAAIAAAAAAGYDGTNGNGELYRPKSRESVVSCAPTLPESAIVTPSVRGPRLDGQRNLQDSTFSISGKHFLLITPFLAIQLMIVVGKTFSHLVHYDKIVQWKFLHWQRIYYIENFWCFSAGLGSSKYTSKPGWNIKSCPGFTKCSSWQCQMLIRFLFIFCKVYVVCTFVVKFCRLLTLVECSPWYIIPFVRL